MLPISTWKSGEIATKDSSTVFCLIKDLQRCSMLPKFSQSFTLAFHSHSTLKRTHKRIIVSFPLYIEMLHTFAFYKLFKENRKTEKKKKRVFENTLTPVHTD